MSVFKSNSGMHGVALGLAGFFTHRLRPERRSPVAAGIPIARALAAHAAGSDHRGRMGAGFSASGPVLLALCAAALWSISTILMRLTKLSEPTSVNMLMTNRATSQFLVFEALRRASASTIAPLEFTSLLWAFVIQFAVWGNVPDGFVMLGALLIGCSGLVIVSIEWKESMRVKRARLG